MAYECHHNIYFEGCASLSHFYVPTLRPHHVQIRAEVVNCRSVPRVKTNAGEKAMSVRGPKFWNAIKKELRSIESLESFKQAISEWYLNV